MSTTVPTVTTIYIEPTTQTQPQTQDAYPQKSSWRNKPQSGAVASGGLIFMTGGMSLAQGLGWNFDTYITTTKHFQFCWFIGCLAGAVVAAPFTKVLPQKIYMIISSILVLVAGIIFTSVPYYYSWIVAARYINGIGVGFATTAFAVYASEIATRYYRGTALSVEQYGITFGIFIQVIYSSQWTYDTSFAANRVNGIISIIFGVMALCGVAAIVESPVYYIRKDNEAMALESLRLLQYPLVLTNEKKAMFEELRNYVIENDSYTFAESCMNNLFALLKMIFHRSAVAFSFSLPLSLAVQMGSFIVVGYTGSWILIVFGILRFLGAFITYWLMDGIGRKIVSIFSMLAMAGMLLGVGILFQDELNILNRHKMSIVCALSLLAQFFGGFFTPSSSVYMGEAFPMLAKPYFIAFCVVIENVIHIVIICTFEFIPFRITFIYCVTVAAIMFGFFVFFYITIPETRGTTLREAQARFKHWVNLRIY